MPLATESDACREYAYNVGRECRESAWILTNYDTWERNPFYQGPPQRHPEDDYYDEEGVVAGGVVPAGADDWEDIPY